MWSARTDLMSTGQVCFLFPIGSVGRGDEANFTLTVSEHKKPASTNGWALIQLVAVRLLPELYLP